MLDVGHADAAGVSIHFPVCAPSLKSPLTNYIRYWLTITAKTTTICEQWTLRDVDRR